MGMGLSALLDVELSLVCLIARTLVITLHPPETILLGMSLALPHAILRETLGIMITLPLDVIIVALRLPETCATTL